MKTKPKKIVLFICLSGLTLLLGVLAIAVSAAYLDRRQAERLLVAFSEISVGSTDISSALRVTGSFQPHRSEGTVSGFAEWVFHYDNRILFKIGLAPYTSVEARLVFKDGVVQEKGVTVFVASGFAAQVTERKRGFGLPNGIATSEDRPHYVGFNRNSDTSFRHITVSDDDSYSEKERSVDWVINLDCLTRLGGCRDARSILPNALPPSADLGNSAH